MSTYKNNRVALVTGASRNIGRATTCALASAGFNVAVHAGHDRKAAGETAAMVRQCGVDSVVCIGDLTNPDTAGQIVDQVIAKFGRLDTLINNAAIRPELPFTNMSYPEWRRVIAVCLDAVFLVTHASLKHLETSDQASIINIGGLTGHTGATNRAHVITSKAGIVGFTKALAHELATKGITVNCVSPGLIDTIRNEDIAGSPQHHATTKNLVNRRGTPEEVADAIVYLTSPSARYITGQTLHVNGGAYLP